MLAVLAIGIFCLCAIRYAVRGRDTALIEYTKRQEKAAKTSRQRVRSHPYQRNGVPVPGAKGKPVAPWGWPGSARQAKPGLSHQLRSFADRLLQEKQLAGETGADPHRKRCIRALLEDRYGRVTEETMPAIEYHPVKPRLLRDPRAPHDQMDNFGTARAERISRKLPRLGSVTTGVRNARGNVRPGTSGARQTVPLKDIKQPWGW